MAVSLLLHGVATAALIDTARRAVPPSSQAADLEVTIVVDAAPPPAEPPPAEPPTAAPPAESAPPRPEPPAATPPPDTVAPAIVEARPPSPAAAPPPPRPTAPRRPSPAATGTAPAAAITVPAPPTAAAPPPSLDDWRGAVLDWVRAHKLYPRAARLRGIEGVVAVRVTVEPGGRVLALAIETSSGSELLDSAVRQMFDGAVLPPFHPAVPETVRTLPLRVGFALTDPR